MLSTTLLLLFGVIFTVVSISMHMLLAWSLPLATAPSWADKEVLTQEVVPALDNSREEGMVHVVTSRFMQHQSDLLSLGKARMKLFETFCLPSMINQQADNFAWFMLADPNLEPKLLNRLKGLLSPYPHFFLVVVNEKVVNPDNLPQMIDDNLFLTGDLDFLQSIMLDTDRPLLLETRLDADDALSGTTLRKLQDTARLLPRDPTGWQVICNDLHYEWRNDEILDMSIANVSAGKLRVVMDTVCVTVGYTLVRHRPTGSIDFPPWPSLGHHLVHREWPQCSSNVTADCWTRLPRYPAALRSRTVTSAGMSRIEATDEDRFYDTFTAKLWGYVERDFKIERENARAASDHLKSNLAAILRDNLKGQWYVRFSQVSADRIWSRDIIETLIACLGIAVQY